MSNKERNKAHTLSDGYRFSVIPLQVTVSLLLHSVDLDPVVPHLLAESPRLPLGGSALWDRCDTMYRHARPSGSNGRLQNIRKGIIPSYGRKQCELGKAAQAGPWVCMSLWYVGDINPLKTHIAAVDLHCIHIPQRTLPCQCWRTDSHDERTANLKRAEITE